MDALVVRANGPLSGTVRARLRATKNAGLKQMAAALLAPGVTRCATRIPSPTST